MANRRSAYSRPVSSPTSRYGTLSRHYSLRKSSRTKHNVLKQDSDSHDFRHLNHVASRPVLVPLHPNLRRLPSRSNMAILRGRAPDEDRDDGVRVGGKRKRVASVNENTYLFSRTTRSSGGRVKRMRSMTNSTETSDDDLSVPASGMDIDAEQEYNWGGSDVSDEDNENDTDSNSDDFWLNEASSRQLSRLRKDELLRLCDLACVEESYEYSTKSELVEALIATRGDAGDFPPSSPPGRLDGNSSGYSSDDGHDGGGEETDAGHLTSLRRRVTVQDFSKPIARAMQGRSFSLNVGTLNGSAPAKRSARLADDSKGCSKPNGMSSRRRTAPNFPSQSSPATSSNSQQTFSPPATRLRSRTISAEASTSSLASLPPSSSFSSTTSTRSRRSSASSGQSKGKRLSKGKHVEFAPENEDSDLTELSEEQSTQISNPSPRRTRSKGKSAAQVESELTGTPRKRAYRTRTRATATKSLHSSDEEGVDDQNDEEEEIDQLENSPEATPVIRRTRAERTPLRKRLRPRRVQTYTPPSDGDDEEENEVIAASENESEGDDSEAEVDEEIEEGDEDAEGEDDVEIDLAESEAADEEGEDEEADEAEVESVAGSELVDSTEEGEEDELLSQPRVLRNGKVVGEELAEEDDNDAADESMDDADAASDEQAAESDDVAEEGDEDEAMEDEFDLSTATQKTLVRLRRDDLVRLCEARDLVVDGTKPQLAQALLEWRDGQEDDSTSTTTSAPSSTSTARPPSTMRRDTRVNGHGNGRRKGSKGKSATPPVLLRSHYHDDEPLTPPVSKEKEKKEDNDLELDLELLGLEDREIPADKLTKLEKIGSGGFKDVYVGKFKGRRVAIAELRDQLSPMDIKELKLLGEFSHPNIVRFLGVSIPENSRECPVMIVSELCANGDLFDYIRNVPAPSLLKVLNLMLDIARGLQYLHERKPSVIHRDCKSSNILITAKGVGKIADFGLAKVKQSTRSMVRSLVGTVNWQAPELWHPHPKYNHKVDVFSCACVFWEMLQWHNPNKKFPWEGMNEHAIYEAVGQKRQRPSMAGLRKQWCPEIVELVDRMWAQDPVDRPGIAEVVEELQDIIKAHR